MLIITIMITNKNIHCTTKLRIIYMINKKYPTWIIPICFSQTKFKIHITITIHICISHWT